MKKTYYTVVFGEYDSKLEGAFIDSGAHRFDLDHDLQDKFGVTLSEWAEAEKGGGIYVCGVHLGGRKCLGTVLIGDSPFEVQLKESSLRVR